MYQSIDTGRIGRLAGSCNNVTYMVRGSTGVGENLARHGRARMTGAAAVAAAIFAAPAAAQDAPRPAKADEERVATTAAGEVVVTGSRAANASINGLNVDPIRLPQNVRLLGQELVDRAGFVDLSQLFDLAGGLSRQNSFGGAWDAYAIRGFSGDINQGPDLLVNRFVSNRGFNARRDVATIQSFQVLKGPASALSGKGEPGGSINIVTKAPLDRFHAGGELAYASFGQYRGVADFGGPVGGGLGARVIAVYQDAGSFRDFVSLERLLFAPSLAWELNDGIRFLYQFEYNAVAFTHDRGVVAVNGDGKAVPRSRFLGEPNDGPIRQRNAQHQGSVYVDLAPGVALEGGVQYRDGSFRGQSTHNATLVGTRLRRQLRIHDYDWQDLSGRIELSANGAWLGLDHQARIGADAFTYDQRRIFFRSNPTTATPYDIDIFNPVYGQPKPVAPLNQDLLEQLEGESIYAQDLIGLGDRVTVLLGLRHDRVRQRNTNYRNSTVQTQSPSRTSPRAAATFMLTDGLSAYASWGRSFRYNQGADAAGAAFPPEIGEAYEGGFKYKLLGGRVTGTLSVFRIDKNNILVNDPANNGFQLPAGSARSEGVEFDVNAQLGRLTLTGVYAYTDARITEDTRPAFVGSGLSNVPRHSGAVYGFWQSAGTDPGSVGIGAGVTYVGERPGDDVNSGFRLPDYITARVNLSYQLTPGLAVQVDAENLFDAYFLESSFSNVWITPGAPRTVRARLKFAL